MHKGTIPIRIPSYALLLLLLPTTHHTVPIRHLSLGEEMHCLKDKLDLCDEVATARADMLMTTGRLLAIIRGRLLAIIIDVADCERLYRSVSGYDRCHRQPSL